MPSPAFLQEWDFGASMMAGFQQIQASKNTSSSTESAASFSCSGQLSTSTEPEGLKNNTRLSNRPFNLVTEEEARNREMPVNRQLILPYILPYLAYVAIASLDGIGLSIEVNYSLRFISVVVLLAWARRWYCSLKGPKATGISIAFGLSTGVIGAVLWIGLLTPFVEEKSGAPWSNLAFFLRLAAAGLLVPLFEELLMRGFIFRLALQWDQARKSGDREALQTALHEKSVNEVIPGDWSWLAVALSTAAFTSGHQLEEWPAAIAFSLLMSFLWVYRKDLISCIVAHAVTNVSLALYVLLTGNWHLW